MVTHGQLELVQIPLGMKPQKRGMVLKPNVLSTWEAIIPGGKGNGFNIQTWGDMTRKYMQPITKLSKDNFMKIIQEMECYVKDSTKGKEANHTVITSDDEEAADFFNFC